MQLKIRAAQDKDLKMLDAFVDEHRYAKSQDYFIHQYESQAEGDRVIFVVFVGEALRAYCILNWQPKYAFFKSMGYPEIQDLNVHKDFRGQGIASALIQHCENFVLEKGLEHMGIGVGLSASYGSAQKLYIKLGYVPDGHGVTYDRKTLTHGEFRPVDDDLCLMMVKDLQT